MKQEWARENDQRIESVAKFFDEAMGSDDSSLDPLQSTSKQLIDRLMEDGDALVGLATTPHDSGYPTRHGVHLASLAIAIGADQGLNREQLMNLCIGCLIHDVGMMAVGTAIFDTDKPLSPAAIRRLADHPVKAIEIAEKYGDSLSMDSRAVLYQIHERCDGSGYPRGNRGDQIHPLAKIAAVADAFVGMAGNRKHRLAIQGYHAIVAIMNDAKNQKFDPHVLRSLLRIASLHPIGSYVKLSNQHIGRVIRTGGDDFVRPTIEMWHPQHREAQPTVIDLAQETSLSILTPLPAAA